MLQIKRGRCPRCPGDLGYAGATLRTSKEYFIPPWCRQCCLLRGRERNWKTGPEVEVWGRVGFLGDTL